MNIIGGVLEFIVDFLGMTILVFLSIAALLMFGWVWPIWWLINKCCELIPESLSPLALLLVPAWALLWPLAGLAMVSVLMLIEVRDTCPRVFGDLIYTLKRDAGNFDQHQVATKGNAMRRAGAGSLDKKGQSASTFRLEKQKRCRTVRPARASSSEPKKSRVQAMLGTASDLQ